ncbi:MAG: hypothetical protein ACYS26_06280 [Planctomycetota bacterium]|jgi:hypothetical protein
MAPPRTARRRRWITLLAALVLGPFLAEFGLRWSLFSSSDLAASLGAPLRDPALFVPPNLLPDYWKIERRIGLTTGLDRHPRFDARIGWRSENQHPETLQLVKRAPLDGRRPVLLFGASFVACKRPEDRCWEELFESESELSERFQLFNYGVWGHGADQTWILMQEVLDEWEHLDPIVVLGIVAESDLYRAALPIYIWPKPRFELGSDGSLVRLDPPGWTATKFLRHDPVSFNSYAWRALEMRFGKGSREELEQRFGQNEIENEGARISRVILTELHADLERRGLEHFGLFFHSRLTFFRPGQVRGFFEQARRLLGEDGLPLVSLEPELAHAADQHARLKREWFHPSGLGQGHPTDAARLAWLPALERGLRGEVDVH